MLGHGRGRGGLSVLRQRACERRTNLAAALRLERIRQHAVVIIPQDTTELDLTRRQEKVGGPLNDDSRWGMFAHVQLAMRPNRLPLGVIAASIWSRDPVEFAKSQKVKRRERKAKPIEEKESFRWLEGYRRACVVAEQAPNTTIVWVADSEGDIYECFLEGLPTEGRKAEWIVRACQDRALSFVGSVSITGVGGRSRFCFACSRADAGWKIYSWRQRSDWRHAWRWT